MTVSDNQTKPLGRLLRRPPRYGVNAAAVALAPTIPTYIRITDIDDSGRFAPDPKVGVVHPKSSEYQMGEGELVFARTGASVGKSYLYDPRDGELVYAGFLINIAPDPNLLNPKYLFLFAQSKDYWNWVTRTSVRSGQPGVNGREYAQLPVPLPGIHVQNAIADTITDVDDLIATLERLIAKKQAIKQGMMQQFFDRRLTREWKSVRVGEVVARTFSGPSPTCEERNVQGEEWGVLKTTCTTWQQGWDGSKHKVLPTQFWGMSHLEVRTGDSIITKAGPRHRVGVPSYVSSIAPRIVPSGKMICLRPDSRQVAPGFLALALSDSRTQEYLDHRTTGMAESQVNFENGDLLDAPLWLPDMSTQRRILNVLFAVDDQISVLRRKKKKANHIKQGMMQQLLTGRIRLLTPDEVTE